MRDEYDGIILGAGHNALVMQASLARRGLRVLALEWDVRVLLEHRGKALYPPSQPSRWNFDAHHKPRH